MNNNNTLYLLEMGMNDPQITTDIKNHRVRVVENIDIVYKGTAYNMFFEFMQGTHTQYRDTNKRTGAPLKKPVIDVVLKDALFVDTSFERPETDTTGFCFRASYRKSDLERELWKEHHKYTRAAILEIINRYAIKKYNKVVLIEEEATKIINRVGGFREKDIIKKRDFQVDGDFYYTINDTTWTPDHKVVKACRREWEPTKDGRKLVITDTCEVDLVTGKITG